MADALPFFAAETGTYSSTGPSVALSGTAAPLGGYPTRTFASAAADASITFDSGSTCAVVVVKNSSNYKRYIGATWTSGTPAHIDLSTGTLEGTYGSIADSDTVTVFGSYDTGDLTAKSLSLNQNISQTAWTTSGVRVKNTAVTLTDTSSSGTVEAAYTNVWGGNTIAASNTTTFTDYATHYFNAPVAGSNVTITNAWAAIFNGNVKAQFRNITEAIYYAELTSNVTVDWANGDVQYFYVNPSGASIQITLPSDPGALSKSGILFVKNNTGKAHTWNTSPAVRFVDQADADTVPTPAAVGYYTRYTCQWMDNNGGTGAWWVTVAGRDTA